MESSNSDYQVDGPPATNNVDNMMTNQEKSQNNNSQQKQSQSKSPFESSPLTLNDNTNFKATATMTNQTFLLLYATFLCKTVISLFESLVIN